MGGFDLFKKQLQALWKQRTPENIPPEMDMTGERQARAAIGRAYIAGDEAAREYISAQVLKGMATFYASPQGTELLKTLQPVSVSVQLKQLNEKLVSEPDYQAFLHAASYATHSPDEIRRIQQRAPKMGLVPPASVLRNLLAEACLLGGNAVVDVRCEIKKTEKEWGDSRWNSAVELNEEAVITGWAAIVKEAKKADTF